MSLLLHNNIKNLLFSNVIKKHREIIYIPLNSRKSAHLSSSLPLFFEIKRLLENYYGSEIGTECSGKKLHA